MSFDHSSMKVGPVRGVFSTGTSSEGERRPSGALGKKDFRKVLDKEDEGRDKNEDEENVSLEQSALDVASGRDPGEALAAAGSAMLSKQKNVPSSLFDLSSTTKGDPLSEQKQEQNPSPMQASQSAMSKKSAQASAKSDSPSALFSKLAQKEPVEKKADDTNLDGLPLVSAESQYSQVEDISKDQQINIAALNADKNAVLNQTKAAQENELAMLQKSKDDELLAKSELMKQQRVNNRSDEGRPIIEKVSSGDDSSSKKPGSNSSESSLSYNPLAEARAQAPLVNPAGDQIKLETPQANSKDLKELIDQIVREMYVVKYDGKSDTVVTLRYPPLFDGATMTLTSFDSARGEFNIRFENLTQVAKELVDMKLNQDSLLQALHKEGYNVHIITTSTLEARSIFVADSQPSKEGEQEEQGRQGSKEGRRQGNERENS